MSWLDFHYHHTLDFNYIHLLQTMDIIPSEITYCRFSPLFWCNIRNKRTSLDNRWHEQHDCVYICKTVDAWSQNSHTFKTKNINKNLLQHDRSSSIIQRYRSIYCRSFTSDKNALHVKSSLGMTAMLQCNNWKKHKYNKIRSLKLSNMTL